MALREISARVGAIVGGRHGGELGDAAAELAIPESDLRTLLELRLPPLPDDALADLICAVVRRFGVDPTWLVTGRYDVWSHSAAEELSAERGAVRDQVARLMAAGPADRPVEIERVRDADRSAPWPADRVAPAPGGREYRADRRASGTDDRAPDEADDHRDR